MEIPRRTTVLLLAFLTWLSVPSGACAAVLGNLEAPDGSASQVSNVQGWAYTTTPGAELIQPFDVRIDGVVIQQVPCCSDRGDVKDVNPSAPLQTGFSGVVNWAREALDATGPVVVSVVIRDTAGGELVLENTVDLYALATFPFSRSVSFSGTGGVAAEAEADPEPTSRCTLANVSDGALDRFAEITCTNLVSVKGNGLESDLCPGEIRFTWDKASQGFTQSSGCEEQVRWVDNGDGTATDNTTGLMWELKVASGPGPAGPRDCSGEILTFACLAPHGVDNRYDWSTGAPFLRDGAAFELFLGQLNEAMSVDGVVTEGCFAGHCDWRLPTVEELLHIRSVCSDPPLCDTLPGEVPEGVHYWSATAVEGAPGAWRVTPNGISGSAGMTELAAVRAVRGAAKKLSGGGLGE